MKLCYERDPGSDKNAQGPLYLVAIVYEWSQLKLKGEGEVNMILSTPFHPQQKMVKQVNRNIVVLADSRSNLTMSAPFPKRDTRQII